MLNIALVVLAGGGVGPLVVTNVINGSSAIGEKMGAHTQTENWGGGDDANDR